MKSVTGGHKGTVAENEHDSLLAYRLGGLLYIPAGKEGIAQKIEERKYPCLTSVAFCLEDAIAWQRGDEEDDTWQRKNTENSFMIFRMR